jgi:4-amino-4-deoxy-L-arabinose transferase-like glycosyltransferase
MPNLLLSYNPLFARIGLIVLGLVLVAAYLVYYSYRVRKTRASAASEGVTATAGEPQLFGQTVRPGSSIAREIMRAVLILLAIWIAVSLGLLFLPDGAIDRMAQALRLRSGQLPPQERISLLYLGDETRGKEFHIRGVVRNISTQPIEKLDATVRLYAADGSLLETAVVRMETEIIAPDATSSFDLTFPEYAGQFGSYAVDFKLRQGEAMSYKDMRHGG